MGKGEFLALRAGGPHSTGKDAQLPAQLPEGGRVTQLGSTQKARRVPEIHWSSGGNRTSWALFCPTFLSVKNLCVFVLCDLVKID